MKTLFLILYVTLLFTWLCVEPVRAQIDTTIYLYCGPVSGGCSYTVTEVRYSTGGSWDKVGAWEDGNSFSITINDTLHSSLGFPSFYIDTPLKMVRSLNYGREEFHHSQFVQTPDGDDKMQVTFDSLPYNIAGNGSIYIRGNYQASVSFNSFREGGEHEDYYSGSCDKKYMIMDSVSMLINTSLSAVDFISHANFASQLIFRAAGYPLIFPLEGSNRKLDIINLLGSTIYSTTVPANISQVALHYLPPGLYFARLGNEVTKFVVTE